MCWPQSGAHNDVRAEGKGRSVQRPYKRLKFENVLIVVPLLFLACMWMCTNKCTETSQRTRKSSRSSHFTARPRRPLGHFHSRKELSLFASCWNIEWAALRTFLDIILCTVCTLTHHHHWVVAKFAERHQQPLSWLPSKFGFNWLSLLLSVSTCQVNSRFHILFCQPPHLGLLPGLAVHFCFLLRPWVRDMAHAPSLFRWQCFACKTQH